MIATVLVPLTVILLTQESDEDSECDNGSDTNNDIVCKTKATISGDDHTTMYQDNHITLDKSSGSMTITINNRSSTPATSSTSSANSTDQSSSSSASGQKTVTTLPSGQQ